MELELGDLGLERLDLVLLNEILDRLDLRRKVGVGGGVAHSAVIVALHDQLFGLTAARGLAGLKVSLPDGQRGDVAGGLIVEPLHRGQRIVKCLVGGSYGLSRSGVDRAKDVSRLGLDVLAVESTVDVVLDGVAVSVVSAEAEAAAAQQIQRLLEKL